MRHFSFFFFSRAIFLARVPQFNQFYFLRGVAKNSHDIIWRHHDLVFDRVSYLIHLVNLKLPETRFLNLFFSSFFGIPTSPCPLKIMTFWLIFTLKIMILNLNFGILIIFCFQGAAGISGTRILRGIFFRFCRPPSISAALVTPDLTLFHFYPWIYLKVSFPLFFFFFFPRILRRKTQKEHSQKKPKKEAKKKIISPPPPITGLWFHLSGRFATRGPINVNTKFWLRSRCN